MAGWVGPVDPGLSKVKLQEIHLIRRGALGWTWRLRGGSQRRLGRDRSRDVGVMETTAGLGGTRCDGGRGPPRNSQGSMRTQNRDKRIRCNMV